MLKKILIIEDDEDLAQSLVRSFGRENYQAQHATSLDETLKILADFNPQYAVVDLKINCGSGIEAIKFLHNFNKNIKIVVLTGYASITTTISAIKSGAHYYLAKPANVAMIIQSFENDKIHDTIIENEGVRINGNQAREDIDNYKLKTTSLKNLEWEYIHQILTENNFNISKTSRILNMHRRTLTRKLQKRGVKF